MPPLGQLKESSFIPKIAETGTARESYTRVLAFLKHAVDASPVDEDREVVNAVASVLVLDAD
eukprot:2812315-Amphidinium_carterae.1